MDREAGILYVVATPIGNLRDITLRGLEVLKSVQLIAAEDTRWTRKLLTHFDIHVPLVSFNEHNQHKKIPYLLFRLKEGDSIALVSNAGTPAVSDPGAALLDEAWNKGVTMVPLPGPSALTAIASISGFQSSGFYFAGFLPRRKGKRKKKILELASLRDPIIFFESPMRIHTLINELSQAWGDRRMVLARELTKIHEEIWRGRFSQFEEQFGKGAMKGEVTIMAAGSLVREREDV